MLSNITDHREHLTGFTCMCSAWEICIKTCFNNVNIVAGEPRLMLATFQSLWEVSWGFILLLSILRIWCRMISLEPVTVVHVQQLQLGCLQWSMAYHVR